MTLLCSNCQRNQKSMDMWIVHLVHCHPLPTEWLSDKAKMLTADENQRPYTVVTDSRKRRRRPTTPRPLNTFMIFSRHIRRNILSIFPEASNSLVSKELGVLWKLITHDVKSCYEEEAKRLAQLHAQEFPDYKYQPKKRSRRYERVSYEHQISPTNISHASIATDDDNLREKDNRSSSDVENQYIRYSVLGKNIVKECQTFNSPQKKKIKEEDFVSDQQPRPFNVRLSNFGDPNVYLKQPRNNFYTIPSESLVSHHFGVSHVVSEDLYGDCIVANGGPTEQDVMEEDIDITSNIFGNDLEIEWSEYDDDDDKRYELPPLNNFF